MSSEGSKEIDEAPRRLASKVYAFLRSRQFTNDLYRDILSDLKDKSTFIKAREYLNSLMNQVEKIPNFADDKIATEHKKNIVAEICSVAYAIDTVFSKVLFMRLEKEYKSGIHEALKKLKDEGKISDDVLAALEIISSSSIEDSNENKEINSKASTSGQVKEKQNSSNEDKTMQNDKLGTRKSTRRRKKTPQKYVAPAPQSESESGTLHSGGEKSSAPPISENMNNAIQKDMENIFSSAVWDSEDSDTSSNISFGEKSVSSVSSVHTSDLSSFDDEISLSDEDGTKRKFSVTELTARTNIKVPPKLADELNETKLKTSSNSSKKNDAEINYTLEIKEDLEVKEESPSNLENGESTPPEKILDKLSESSHSPASSTTSVISTKRVRKPNSKYASEDIVCLAVKIKERKKQNVDYAINEGKEMSTPISPKKKRTRNESSDVEVETPSKVQKKGIKKPTTSDGTSPETPDSKKPQACIRSLTSRRTAPVTLFSTA